ncbi:MAG: hypothetical protein GYB53_17460 [Rhodobacteraceae bacterium]|nr:hypothetical protein [Paracoccaceae bacterium]MBR9821953.1 hypothetical protein [Paracoccaceae bacterium]
MRLLFQKSRRERKSSVRASMKIKRRSLLKDWAVLGRTGSERQGVKRAVEHVVRKGLTYDPQKAHIQTEDYVEISRSMRPSLILDGIYPERTVPGRWTPVIQRDLDVSPIELDLGNFSFLENPEATLLSLREIAKIEAGMLSAKLHFVDRECLDIAAFMALMECWPEMVPIFEGGHMQLPMQKVLAATGVSQAMGIGLGGVTDFDDVWAFPLTRRRKPGTTRSKSKYVDVPTRDTATSRFCNAMDDWLGQPDIGLELSASGVDKLMRLLGEVLENAERHSDGERRDGAWAVSGFLSKRPRDRHGDAETEHGDVLYHANIGIVSVGDTFSQSLDRAHPNQVSDITAYIGRMRRAGAMQSDETLRTVCALQDTVTCVPEAEEESRGGYGLMDILDFVSGLGHTEEVELRPRVTIVSGKSCIKLRGEYISGSADVDDNSSPRVQWFNKENSARVAPDPENVYDLPLAFPGTVISISFCLDPRYLSKVFRDV